MKATTIISAQNGQEIQNKSNIKIEPLMLMGKPIINQKGNPVMNDRWIFTKSGTINIWRSRYCEKMALAEITIQESMGEKKLMDNDLKTFVNCVSDKLVFEKFGKWYRIYLTKKTNRTFGIKKVVPYNFTVAPNKKFGGHHSHQLCIDWRDTFYV